MNKEIFNEYLKIGFQMIRAGKDKKPYYKRINANGTCDKRNAKYNEFWHYLAVVNSGLLVIDVDVKNGKRGLESLEKLEADLMIDLREHANVVTGSGGLHIYIKTDFVPKQTQSAYPDIDFISPSYGDICNPYVMAGDQVIEVNGEKYSYELLHLDLLPISGEELEEVLQPKPVISYEPDNEIDISDLYPTHSADDVLTLLKWHDAEDYHEWVANASAIYSELGEEGFDVYDRWSATASNYNGTDETRKKWDSVKRYGGKRRTYGTLVYKAIENKANAMLTDIKKAGTLKDVERLVTRYGDKIKIPKDARKEIVQLMVKRFGLNRKEADEIIDSISGIVDSSEAVEKSKALIAEVIETNEAENDNDYQKDDEPKEPETPYKKALKELSKYVKVMSFTRNQFYNIDTGARYDDTTLGAILSENLAIISTELGAKKPLGIKEMIQAKAIRVATKHEYNPLTFKRLFIDDAGQLTLNLFDSRSLPYSTLKNGGAVRPEAMGYIERFEQHVKLLMGEEEGEIMLDYMAYLAQNIGKKVLWTPLIQSVEGIGKSLIGNALINHVYGRANAGVADTIVVVESRSTGWATNTCLRVLEEIKLSGHNRYEVLNQLKPLITNDFITRTEKYEMPIEVRNTCNFIAFTNYKDALPLDQSDRRWWVVFSPITSLDELEAQTGLDREDYFEPLHYLASSDGEYGKDFKQWLLNRDVSAFNPKFPPETKFKDIIRELESAKIEGYDEVVELITDLNDGKEPAYINIRDLKRYLPDNYTYKKLRGIIERLGYEKITGDFLRLHGIDNVGGFGKFYYNPKHVTMQEAMLQIKKDTKPRELIDGDLVDVDEFDEFDDFI